MTASGMKYTTDLCRLCSVTVLHPVTLVMQARYCSDASGPYDAVCDAVCSDMVCCDAMCAVMQCVM